MPRRKESLLRDIYEITAGFPWWVGVVLAIVSYVVLHQVATMELALAPGTKGVGDYPAKALIKALAFWFQYIVPVAFLFGAVASMLARRKRAALYKGVSANDDALAAMSWKDFELLVGEFFRNRGFAVTETGGGGADGGVDLVASLGADRYVVQCKQWKARQVGVATVRELYGVMTAMGAVGGFVVASGEFTNDARSFAEGREIKLLPATELLELVRGSQRDARQERKEPTVSTASPSCPQCGATMVMRTAHKGADAGNQFWGCSTFPKCRGTRAA